MSLFDFTTSILFYDETGENLIDMSNELWYPRETNNPYSIIDFSINRKEKLVVSEMLDFVLHNKNDVICNLEFSINGWDFCTLQIDLDYLM